MGRTVCGESIHWWQQQGKEAQDVLSDKYCVSCIDAYTILKDFLIKNNFSKHDRIFSRRLFETKLLEHFIEDVQKHYPSKNVAKLFDFWQFLDTATFLYASTKNDFAGIYDNELKALISNLIPHNAMHDCVKDVIRIFMCSASNHKPGCYRLKLGLFSRLLAVLKK